MSKILAYTSPALGHLYPLTPVLKELVAGGHEVILRTRADCVEMMRGFDVDAAAVDQQIENLELDDWRASNPRKALELSVGLLAERAQYESAELTPLIEETAPDFVLVDSNCFGALAAAEAWGGPWAAFCPFPLPLASRDAPPFGPGLKPAAGPAGRLRDRMLRPLVARQLGKAMLPPINRVRAANKIEPLTDVDEIFRKPPLVLSMTSEPFEYRRSDWPASIVMIGACAWEPPATAPAWLDAIDKPIVLVTTSSEFQNDGRLIETAFTALADEDVEVVATAPAEDIARFSPPANGRVVPFTPHAPILAKATCAITHGGMGATQKALANGVPVCAVPFGRDQMEVARRVEVSGGGTMLSARKLSAERLRGAVAEARRKQDGARRVAAGYEAAGGATAALAAIESLIEQPAEVRAHV
ncbi:MAG: glycosyltransferase [Solirubrobacterales bacterium]